MGPRTHIPTLFVVSVLINIGMWFERYVIIITGLSREYDPAVWGVYTPSWAELIDRCRKLRLLLSVLPPRAQGDPDRSPSPR